MPHNVSIVNKVIICMQEYAMQIAKILQMFTKIIKLANVLLVLMHVIIVQELVTLIAYNVVTVFILIS